MGGACIPRNITLESILGEQAPPHPPCIYNYQTLILICPRQLYITNQVWGEPAPPHPLYCHLFFIFNAKRYQTHSKQPDQAYQFIQTYSFTFLAQNILKASWEHVRWGGSTPTPPRIYNLELLVSRVPNLLSRHSKQEK